MNQIKKWKRQYTSNIDLRKLYWIKLNGEEMDQFLTDNYLDKTVWQYVHDETADQAFPTILGMTFLTFNSPIINKRYHYLLGVVDNRIGKKTIVAATTFLEDYILYPNQSRPATYISTMEVNKHFREKGIFKQMAHMLGFFIKRDQHVITTKESDMGELCHTFEAVKRSLKENGFQKLVIMDDSLASHGEYYDEFCKDYKVYEKKD